MDLRRLGRRRTLTDSLAAIFVHLGGISVIVAITLIFFYLFYVVVPMFKPADVSALSELDAPGGGTTVLVDAEEQGEMAVRFTADGRVIFFSTEDGRIVDERALDLPVEISSIGSDLNTVALGLNDGRVLAVKYSFKVEYLDNKRSLIPKLEYPFGEQALELDEKGQALTHIALRIGNDEVGIAATTSDYRILFAKYSRETSFIDESITFELVSKWEKNLVQPLQSLLMAPAMNSAYGALSGGTLMEFRLSKEGFKEDPIQHRLDHEIKSLEFLLGGVSLLIGLDNGEIEQRMPVRTEEGTRLTSIRRFQETSKPITAMAIEKQRKGFAAADASGQITIYYATSQRTLANINTAGKPIGHMAWSARAKHLVAVDRTEKIQVYKVRNEYPEVSWDVLWSKVWYEGYPEPDYIWQSSAATNEFEPKLSLIPLSFGTIKAAVYAMLFAVPIAILGAIYTAQFMAPKMRRSVKPSIEIMEALPTVILGFLAGLWLAPTVENHLPGIFALLLVLPVGFIFSAWCFRYIPWKSSFDGWEAAVLIPVVLVLVGISMSLSVPIEQALFDGDMRAWLNDNWGLSYDQRNSLVVGLIMGFAVIPTIFSIAEDSLFGVPRHLIRGSLALGATRWQTLLRVVLPASSPGIFSALMMGFGRAIGETMIVLMATGNTPVMDMSLFQGMRTLSANIAVEVPEAEVASTHYRVLFLAALVLFLFTFVFNTAAELIRQRLRERYSAL